MTLYWSTLSFSFLSKAITARILSTIAGGFLSRIVSSAVSEYTLASVFLWLSIVAVASPVAFKGLKHANMRAKTMLAQMNQWH